MSSASPTGRETLDADLGFIHEYVAPAAGEPNAGVTLLLLHGTGGDERDLLGVGRLLAPGAGLLSPRGKTLEHGMARFFRRLAEGVFDEEDLRLRTHELAAFVASAARRYGFDPQSVVAAGFSNGANIAASLLFLSPRTLAGALLFHAQVPLEPAAAPNLRGVPVFLGAGERDPLIPAAETRRLAALLAAYGADVEQSWQPGGHALTRAEVQAGRAWLAAHAAALSRHG